MNHQTDKIINDAINIVADDSVFSECQMNLLVEMILKIAEAIEKETRCSKESCL